jgi:preprotein translocase subunit SecD
MDKKLRWRALAIIAVVAVSVWGFTDFRAVGNALQGKAAAGDRLTNVRLGLDLQGGVHLVLRVQTDDALRLDTETTMEQLQEAVEGKGLTGVTFAGVDPTRFKVEGVPQAQDAAFREAAIEVETRFNRESGAGGAYQFVMKPNLAVQLREDAVEQALQTIERRVNELGVAEPIVARTGAAGDQIMVQLPGVANPQRAKDIIRSTALLELKIVEDGPASTKEQLLQARSGVLPGNMEVVPGVSDTGAPGERAETVYFLVRKVAAVTGRDLRNAKPTLDENGRPAVGFSLNQDGARKFGKATGENIGRRLAIILDGRVQSAPVIEDRIFDEGRISGTFTQQEVQDLSLVLRSGALPASLIYLEERTVGPSLGAESIRSGVTAALGGLGLVVIFLLLRFLLEHL